MLDRPNGPLKLGLRKICLKSKKLRKLIRFFINISGVLVIHDHLVKFWFNLLKKLYTSNSTERFKNIIFAMPSAFTSITIALRSDDKPVCAL